MLSAMDKPPPAPREPAAAPDAVAEVRVLRREHETFAEQGTQAAFATWPRIRGRDAAMRATREDLAFTLHVVAAGTLVGDRDFVTDLVGWFETVLAARASLGLVPSTFDLLLGVLPPGSRLPATWPYPEGKPVLSQP